MDSQQYPLLEVERQGSVVTISLNRPDVHNAFNATMITSLTTIFHDLAQQPNLRAVVLRGNGPSFSAGGDLNWMHASVDWTFEQNIADARALATMYNVINASPFAVVGRIHGAAMGGGVGLVAVCDIAIAADSTRFALSEAKLGLAPATIAPYVIAKIGQTHARALFLTAERFDASRALSIGLIHRTVSLADLDAATTSTVAQLQTSGIQAIRAAKHLTFACSSPQMPNLQDLTVETIAKLRTSAEGQEGLRAFLEKRKATWVEE